MRTFYPTLEYIRIVIVTMILSGLVLVVYGHPYSRVLIVIVCALAYTLPTIIAQEKLQISPKGILTHHIAFRQAEVADLSKLTNCNYRMVFPIKSLPYMGFHLYDAQGGYLNISANEWWRRNEVYQLLKDAVLANNVSINEKTRKKLNI